MTPSGLLLVLIVIFAAAKLFGELAERIGQPAVLGEMVGGIVVGVSGLHLVDPHDPVIHLLSELGVVLLLFLVGLETDLKRLLSVGGASASVALFGVAFPFAAGAGVGSWLGYPPNRLPGGVHLSLENRLARHCARLAPIARVGTDRRRFHVAELRQ